MADEKIVPVERKPISDVMKDCITSDIRTVGYEVLTETIIPGSLDLVHQAISTALDRILHPYGVRYSGGITMRRYNNQQTQQAARANDYHNSYKKEYAKQDKKQREMDRIDAVYVWPFYIEGKAVETLDEMKNRIRLNGKVTVAEFYDIGTDQLPISTDWEWGWVDLEHGTRIVRGRDGNGTPCFYISLPKVIPVK